MSKENNKKRKLKRFLWISLLFFVLLLYWVGKDAMLIYSVKNNNLPGVEKALKYGAGINARDIADGPKGRTALMCASSKGHYNMAKFLIENGADINLTTEWESTALHYATYDNHLKIVQLLVENGADVNHKRNFGGTILMQAAQQGHLDIVKYLLNKGAEIDAKDEDGETALMNAAYYGHFDVVKTLVENGANINVVSEELTYKGITALMQAINEEHIEVATFLINSGADFKLKDRRGKSALSMASKKHHTKLIKLMVESDTLSTTGLPPTDEEFVDIIYSGNLIKIQRALTAGANVNVRHEHWSGYGQTALIWAAESYNKLGLIKLLIENGADVNAKTKMAKKTESFQSVNSELFMGYTALMEAARKGSFEKTRVLVENGADVNVQSYTGMTPLLCASVGRRVKLVQYLLEQGADIHAKTNNGINALMIALLKSPEIARLLIDKGVDIHAQSEDGETALSRAVTEGHTEIANELIKRGVDVNIPFREPYNNGRSILGAAVYNGLFETAQLLVEHGADVNAKDNDSTSILLMDVLYKGRDDSFKPNYFAEPYSSNTPEPLKEIYEKQHKEETTRFRFENAPDFAQFLVANGADVNARDADGNTALIKACRKGFINLATFLLSKEADVNAQNKYGNTAFIITTTGRHFDTASEEHRKMIKLLIDNGTDVNIENLNGRTALINAVYNKELEMIKLLLKYGADANALSRWGISALSVAKERNYTEIEEVLTKAGAK